MHKSFLYYVDPEYAVGKYWKKIYKIVTIVNGRPEVYADLETENVHESVKHCNLRIHNKFLYDSNRNHYIDQLFKEFNFQFLSISRIDLAIDFQRFESTVSQQPDKFIKQVFNGYYIKTGKASFKAFSDNPTYASTEKFFAYSHSGEKVRVTGCVFGKSTSGMQMRLYNKSEEMRVKMVKPWVVDNWKAAGFDMEADTWRLEFQINVKDFMSVDRVTGDAIQYMKDVDTITEDRLKYITSMLYQRHFKFHRTQITINGKRTRLTDRKRRLPEVYPLKMEDFGFVKVAMEPAMASGRTQRSEVKRMVKLWQEVKDDNEMMAISICRVIGYRLSQYNLSEWFYEHFAYLGMPDFNDLFSDTMYVHKDEKHSYKNCPTCGK